MGAGVYSITLVQKVTSELKVADARIVELEQQLAMTGDEATESVTALRAKLKWADSEIRKLWGVSHDTNRKAISSNKNALAQLKKQVGQASSVVKVAGNNKTAIASLEAELVSMTAALDMAQDDIAAEQKQLRTLADTNNRTASELASLKSDLQSRVAANEEAVVSFDAYRRTTNRELLQLKQASGVAP